MVHSFSVTNYLNERIRIKLSEADPDHGLLLIKAEGLGPVKADINTTALATRDGSKYNSAKAKERSIKLTLRFTFAKTIEDVRHLTYKYFPLKQPLTLMVETDNRSTECIGYVSENDPEIWSELEATTVVLTCPDPWMYDAITKFQETTFFGVTPLFEFPFENDSLTENLIEFGNLEIRSERIIRYTGDAEVGIMIYIKVLNPIGDITFYKINTREKMVIYCDKIEAISGYGISRGDEIIISTATGDKSAKLLRRGVYYNILNAIDRYSDWFKLSKGDNIFVFDTDVISNLQVRFRNRLAYEGI